MPNLATRACYDGFHSRREAVPLVAPPLRIIRGQEACEKINFRKMRNSCALRLCD